MEFELNQQVVHARQNGQNKELRVGTILSFAQGGTKAIVSFPEQRSKETVKVDDLRTVREVYRRDKVPFESRFRSKLSLA